MKKLLALVLAMVMTLGLATVGASAKTEYKDASDIKYTEAVDVMTAIGVLGGDENGFRPQDELKRSEGAKIITYLLLGKDAAEQLTGGSKFTDVPSTHWAAGYIEYLTVEGVVGGIGDNKFDPDGTLTTAQFAKMLLGALGYDATIEGFGGPDWMINVQALAKKVNLFDRNSSAVVSANIKREEAALYAFNMLKSPLVEYENKGSTMSVNGAEIKFGASKATFRTDTGKNMNRYTQIDNTTTNNVLGNAAVIVEFAEEYFDKLVVNNRAGLDQGVDAFMRPCNQWYFDGKEIGTYTKTPDLHYTTTVTSGQIYKDLGLTDDTPLNGVAGSWCNYYIDGRAYNADYAGIVTLKKEDNSKLGGNGTETYVYYDEGVVTVCESNWYVGDVSGVYAATATKEAYIDIAGRGAEPDKGTATQRETSGTKKTTDYAVNDVVIYTASWKNKASYNVQPSIEDIAKGEVVTGELNSFVQLGLEGVNGNATGSVTLGGKKYDFAAKVASTPDGTFIKNGVKLEVVLDKYGYALDVSDYGVQNYAVVINSGYGGGSFADNKAVELLLTDGTSTGAVTLNGSDHGWNNFGAGTWNTITAATRLPTYESGNGTGATPIEKGDIVTYTIGSNGNYSLVLKSKGATYDNTARLANKTIVSNSSSAINPLFNTGVTVWKQNATTGAYTPGTKGALAATNGKTVFLIKDATDNYKAYVGIKDVPSLEANSVIPAGKWIMINSYAGQVANNDKQNYAASQIVFIDNGDGLADMFNNESVFVHVDRSVARSVNSNGDTYYEVEAYVNGERTMLKVDVKSIDALVTAAATTGVHQYALFKSITRNSRDIASLGSQVAMGRGTMPEKNGVIGLGNAAGVITYRSYTKDCKVFYINDNNEITTSSIKGIPESTTTRVWTSVDSSSQDANYIYWTKNTNVASAWADGWSIPTTGISTTISAGDATLAELRKAVLKADVVYITDVPSHGYALPTQTNEDFTVPAGVTLVVEGDFTVPNVGNNGTGWTATPAGQPDKVLTVNGNLVAEEIVINGGVAVGSSGYLRANKTFSGAGHVEVNGTVVAVGAGTNLLEGNNTWKFLTGALAHFAGPVNITGTVEVPGDATNVDLMFAGALKATGSATVQFRAGNIDIQDSLEVSNSGGFVIGSNAKLFNSTDVNESAEVDVLSGGILSISGKLTAAMTLVKGAAVIVAPAASVVLTTLVVPTTTADRNGVTFVGAQYVEVETSNVNETELNEVTTPDGASFEIQDAQVTVTLALNGVLQIPSARLYGNDAYLLGRIYAGDVTVAIDNTNYTASIAGYRRADTSTSYVAAGDTIVLLVEVLDSEGNRAAVEATAGTVVVGQSTTTHDSKFSLIGSEGRGKFGFNYVLQ